MGGFQMGLLASFKTILGFEDELETRDRPVGQSTTSPSLKRMVPTNRLQLQDRLVAADFQTQKQPKKTELPQLNGMGIIIVEPRSYESDSRQISAYLKAGHVVVVNLKFLDAPTGKRLIDFICGTIYAFEGYVKKLGGNIFLCTPGSVSVVDNQEDEVVFNEQPVAEVPQPEVEEEPAPYYYRTA
jgi:FtsZ-interacting cell division protein YlmF